jgi:hypothetical protein
VSERGRQRVHERDPRERSEHEHCASRASKNGGDPEGESPDRPMGLLGSRCEVGARGGYAARTDLPRSLAMAWRSICRTRSAVIPQIAPISASLA